MAYCHKIHCIVGPADGATLSEHIQGHFLNTTNNSTIPIFVKMRHISLTQSTSLPPERKAPTNRLQPARSWTSQLSSMQVFSSHFHLFFTNSSTGAQWSASFFRCSPFQNGAWKTIPAHAENTVNPSPPSLLHFTTMLLMLLRSEISCHSLLPT